MTFDVSQRVNKCPYRMLRSEHEIYLDNTEISRTSLLSFAALAAVHLKPGTGDLLSGDL